MAGLVEKFKYLLGLTEDLEDEQEEQKEHFAQEKEVEQAPMVNRAPASSYEETLDEGLYRRKKISKPNSNIIDISTAPSNEMVIIEPKNNDDAIRVVSLLRSKKAVIVSYAKSALSNDQREGICNFICGAICALDGHTAVISKDAGVYLFTPGNISITNSIPEQTQTVTSSVDKSVDDLFMTINDINFSKEIKVS